MDHIDWLDAPAARQVAAVLGRQVVPGGHLILRSAALCPPYVRFIREAGFEVGQLHPCQHAHSLHATW